MVYYNYYKTMYHYGFAKNKDIWDMTKYGFLTVAQYKEITGLEFNLEQRPE